MENVQDSKIEKFDQTAKAVLFLLDRHGLEAITFARVHQVSKVSRPWLYKYIGKDKNDLVKFAVNTLGRQWTRLDQNWSAQNAKELLERLVESTIFTMQFARENPMVIGPYFRFQGTSTPIGELISTIEEQFINRYVKELMKHSPFSKSEARDRATMIMLTRLSWSSRASKDKTLKPDELRHLFQHVFKAVINP